MFAGEWLLDRAARFPHHNYIGVEVQWARVLSVLA